MNTDVFFRLSLSFLLILSTLTILFQSNSSAKLNEEDLAEFFKAQENMKIMGQLAESCQIQSPSDLDSFDDCIRIISAFNLKMSDIIEDYGTIIDKYID